MKPYKHEPYQHETIVISKGAWEYLRNHEREAQGFKALSAEQLDRIWSKIYVKNGGASSKAHPISENEIRIDPDTFGAPWERVKELLVLHDLPHRHDGFTEEGFHLYL